MSASLTYNEHVTEIYVDLAILLDTLQTNSIFRSLTPQTRPIPPSFHSFFLTQLPLLLNTRKTHGIDNLRRACTSVANLTSSAEKPVRTRYLNFVRSLYWALDHAEYLLRLIGDTHELVIAKAIRTIFHLVASLCYREWEIEHISVRQLYEMVHASPDGAVPSTQHPVYHPPQRVGSSSGGTLTVGNVSHRTDHAPQAGTNVHQRDHAMVSEAFHAISDDIRTPGLHSNGSRSHQVLETSDSVDHVHNDNPGQAPHPSNYIRNNGKRILPAACIQETVDGCGVPFELILQDRSADERYPMFDLLTCDVEVSYPDNKCFSFIPILDMRVLNPCTTHGFTELDMLNINVDMSTKVYETLINQLKQAYMTRFPGACHVFLIDTDLPLPISSRIEIEIPVLMDCFVRLVYLLWFMENPLWATLEMCQHDVFGCGLLQAEFVEALEGTRIVLSLAGVVVERSLLNYGEKIFEALHTGAVTNL